MSYIIFRLERATEGGDDLDAAIYEALGAKRPTKDDPLYWTSPDGASRHYDALIPAYTRSIDAALTLLPPWSWRVGNLPSGRGFADLGTQKSLQCVEGATPALALCIAALKARKVS